METTFYTDGESYNFKEELANAITHGLGFLLSIPALVVLIVSAVQKGSPLQIVSFTILVYQCYSSTCFPRCFIVSNLQKQKTSLQS